MMQNNAQGCFGKFSRSMKQKLLSIDQFGQEFSMKLDG